VKRIAQRPSLDTPATRRLFRRAVLILAIALAAAGCGGPGDKTSPPPGVAQKKSGPITLAVVPKAVGSDFWKQVHLGAECAAAKHTDVTVQWHGVTDETDVVGQINLLQRLIGQDVDGLVYAATDAAALAPVTDQAIERHKVVVTIDSGTYPQPAGVPLIATDNVAAGTKAADFLAESLGTGDKKIAFLSFKPGAANSDQRAQGFKTGLARYPNLRIVAEESTQSDFATAQNVTARIIATHPDLDGIFASNEPTTLGAGEALSRSSQAQRIKMIGFDAPPEEVKLMERGVIAGLIVQNPFRMGYHGVNAAVKIIREGTTVPSQDTGVTLLRASDLTSPRYQALLNPSCENPPV
jgi:ribose transport system substrate-binding protein